MIKVQCKVCGKSIKCYPSTKHKKKYCSKECRESVKLKKANCLYCGKEFTSPKSRYNLKTIILKCCSRECYNKYITNIKEEIKNKNTYICTNCGKTFIGYRINKTDMKFCSQNCSKKYMVGENSPFYKNGTIGTHGYKSIKIKGKYILEHRILIEKKLKRKLKQNEVVHHIDCNKLNNNIDNLMVMEKKEHDKLHMKMRLQNEKRI